MVRTVSQKMPLYIVNEYPKSGGTWLGSMLAEVLDLPFPRNAFPSLSSCIIHGHYISSIGMKNVVILWRDGRDVMVSWYHHCFFYNGISNKELVKKLRNDLSFSNYHDVKNNLPEFIEYSFTKQRHPPFTWSDFVNSWHNNKDAKFVKYEDLRVTTAEEIRKLVYSLSGINVPLFRCKEIANRYSFENLSNRTPGIEDKNSFMRKGVVGDWQNYFSYEACEIFNKYAGKELVKLGYEKDEGWFINLDQVAEKCE